MEFKVSLTKDEDGYLTQECGSCGRRFKIGFGQGSKGELSHCPYCGQGGERWWTAEQERYLREIATEKVLDPVLKGFADGVNRAGGGRVSATLSRGGRAVAPSESNKPMPLMAFSCCGETIKYEGTESQLYCVICGTVTSVDSRG
jgi:DNA-directed RNA polymerase subunit RPC12/RpoP